MREACEIFACVDLGSAHFVVAVAQRTGSSVEVLGLGKATAAGLEEGILTDISAATQALSVAVREAEVNAECKLSAVAAVGISGDLVSGADQQAAVKIQGGAVTQGDVDLVQDTLQAYPLPANREILHVMQQSYAIDERGGVRQPLGMTGSLLGAEAHIVTADQNCLANIRACLQNCGLRTGRIAASGLASVLAATTADERDMGVGAIDWGAGTCGITIFKNGVLRWLSNLHQGSSKIDLDIARTFRIPLGEGERVKREIGSAVQVPQNGEQVVEVTAANGTSTTLIDAHILSMTIEACIEEMLGEINRSLEPWKQDSSLGAGVVLTGGGAELAGVDEMAHEILGLPVRIGSARYAGPMHEEMAGPSFAAIHGLMQIHVASAARAPAAARKSAGLFKRFFASFSPRRQEV